MTTIYYSDNSSSFKKVLIFSLLFIFALSFVASAQKPNKDSVSLVKKIASDKEKLLKMQNSISDLTTQKQQSAERAQQSADDNRTAAVRLSNDPQDKKLAKKADNTAGDARSDAKKAREASDKLDDTNKDIRNMTERIAKNETKLKKFVVTAEVMKDAPTVIITKDSTIKVDTTIHQ